MAKSFMIPRRKRESPFCIAVISVIQQSNWWNRLGTRPRCINFLTGVAACTISG